jgi:hypothetical protein
MSFSKGKSMDSNLDLGWIYPRRSNRWYVVLERIFGLGVDEIRSLSIHLLGQLTGLAIFLWRA